MYMKEHHVTYKEINIKENEQARSYLINHLKSFSTPTITVDSQIISGFNLEALSEALNQ